MYRHMKWELGDLGEEHDIAGILANIAEEKAVKKEKSLGRMMIRFISLRFGRSKKM